MKTRTRTRSGNRSRIRTRQVVAALVAGLLTMSLAACGGEDEADTDSFTIGLLFPNRVTPRWERWDKPLIERKLKESCPRCTVVYANAGGDVATQRQQMISMITKGARVLILDPADSKAMRSSVQEARRAGASVIAYDRLVEGPISGYVSFNGAQVGRLQGEALLEAMGGGGNIVMMNGDPTSANAAWFRKGALSVITGKLNIARSYDTAAWSTDNAHANMSAAIGALGSDRIGGVLAANDSIAAGVISAFKTAGVRRLPPVTGQDADLDAVQRIIKGEQYMTVYKPFMDEATAAADMAVALGRGEDIGDMATTTLDSATTEDIPAVLLTPRAVTVENIKETLVKDGVYSVEQICTRKIRPACTQAGLSP
ncbi:D-xylose transport system substrate-binding protein [Streptomyces sp. cf386]|uniref:sugar ABC transporter substrate-binding protein n=1 Tax=Streptomyces sp. cf386 TaxID=1761904 RepID=UPI000885B75A|nr:substrate-binding domain-containing protein [Streptomyces sp. cf386]SDO77915.1 D-xylose transport system substrate-binding protein [Streptomyces sp. cf386]